MMRLVKRVLPDPFWLVVRGDRRRSAARRRRRARSRARPSPCARRGTAPTSRRRTTRSACACRPRSRLPRRRRPADVGEQLVAVVLHDVDLAVGRPRAGRAERPERRPHARRGCRCARASRSGRTGSCACRASSCWPTCSRRLAVALPVGCRAHRSGLTTCSRRASMTSRPLLDARVVGLVPLQLLVAHEAALVGPVRRIGRAVLSNSSDQTSL